MAILALQSEGIHDMVYHLLVVTQLEVVALFLFVGLLVGDKISLEGCHLALIEEWTVWTTPEIEEVIVSGGGRHNLTLFKSLQVYMSDRVSVVGMEAYEISADAKEAVIFALLGYQCLKKKTNNLPSATGAKKAVVMGKIAWGNSIV